MSRKRLTTRTAEDLKAKAGQPVESKGSGIDNDVYDMNDTGHDKNDPKLDQYAKGDPEAWKEGVNKDNPAKDDSKREETGHAPLIDKHAAEEAIASAKRLEERAVKAIIASQRMLPGASEEIIEKQAAILLHLPNEGLDATLANQENLAKMIAKAATDSAEEDEKDASSEEKEAGKDESEDEKEDEDKDASVEDKDASAEDKEAKKEEKEAAKKLSSKEKLAALKKEAEELEKEIKASEDEEEKEEGKEEEKEEEDKDASSEEKEAKTDEKDASTDDKEDTTEEKEASDDSILDQIFSGVVSPGVKKGASKLSGMVKKEASTSGDNLNGIWNSAPDISKLF